MKNKILILSVWNSEVNLEHAFKFGDWSSKETCLLRKNKDVISNLSQYFSYVPKMIEIQKNIENYLKTYGVEDFDKISVYEINLNPEDNLANEFIYYIRENGDLCIFHECNNECETVQEEIKDNWKNRQEQQAKDTWEQITGEKL